MSRKELDFGIIHHILNLRNVRRKKNAKHKFKRKETSKVLNLAFATVYPT